MGLGVIGITGDEPFVRFADLLPTVANVFVQILIGKPFTCRFKSGVLALPFLNLRLGGIILGLQALIFLLQRGIGLCQIIAPSAYRRLRGFRSCSSKRD